MQNEFENARKLARSKAENMSPEEREKYIKANFVDLRMIDGSSGDLAMQESSLHQIELLKACMQMLSENDRKIVLHPLLLELGKAENPPNLK